MDELKNLLTLLGLNPLWASVIVILTGSFAYFVKQYLDLRNKLKEIDATYKKAYRGKLDDKLIEYSALQVKSLLEAYRMLCENPAIQKAPYTQFSKAITRADALVMTPFTAYAPFLNESIKVHIYGIHNILEQFKHNPSEASVKQFFDFQHEFFRLIEEAINMLSIHK